MSYSVGLHFENFIRTQLENGRFNNASEIIREGLRLVEERELKLQQLRTEIQDALAEDRRFTSQEVLSHIENNLPTDII